MSSTRLEENEDLDKTEKRPALRLQTQQGSKFSLREEISTARTVPYQWIKTNIVMLVNAGSLIGTTAVTSVLGFAYWWVAARWFPPEAVGIGSATISAMTLLGTVCILGLGTLLIGELPRQPGKEGQLISTALIVVGGVGGCAGIVFALVAPFVAADFHLLGIEDILLFAVGVSITAIALVLDQALIGLLRGGMQLWRNTFFAVTKLGALFAVGLWFSEKLGLTIYATWLVGNVLSLAVLAGYVVFKNGWSLRTYLPQWGMLRKLGPAALQHHLFNLIFQLPPLVLPVLVTIQLSATENAWFYVSYMLANFMFSASYALTTVLHAVSSARPSVLAQKARLTLSLGAVIAIVVNCVFLFATKQVLGLFGHVYAEQATWSLRILALGAFPFMIRGHYIAICRIQRRIQHAILPMTIGMIIELGAAAIGAELGSLPGLSLGWVIGLCVEALWMSPTVYKAVLLKDKPTNSDQLQHSSLQFDTKRKEDTHSEIRK